MPMIERRLKARRVNLAVGKRILLIARDKCPQPENPQRGICNLCRYWDGIKKRDPENRNRMEILCMY